MRVLVVNAGSSSVKLRLLGPADELISEHDLDAPAARVDPAALRDALAGVEADVVGHRIVHGGTRFRSAVRVDAGVLGALRELADLAPLHQPKSLAALEAVSDALPAVPAVACFDTAFHATLPAAASTYALPAEWRRRWGLRRYGFHGLSHAYASRRAAELTGVPPAELRLVSCHLGAGASLCAVAGGRSVETTMGFTPLDGLVMATRSGALDPGMLLWLLERERVTEPQMAEALEHESGLLALAGTTDMRELLRRTDDEARLALDVYVHRLRAGIGAMAAALGEVDAIAFTGGVGENAPAIRARAVEGLAFLGASVDGRLNEDGSGDREVSAWGGGTRVLVIAAREDLEIARQARAAVAA